MLDSNNAQAKAQIVFFSHGGGPMPILGDPGHKAMVEFMEQLPTQLRKPDAILVVSAHWEEPAATLMSAPAPALFYDYYGFPPEAYAITYPALGQPELANRIAALLSQQGLPTALDPQRGFDHGLFIPLKLMYPQADIPALQLSLIRGLSSQQHIALGKALRALLPENILVIGSGFSFHNMRVFGWQDTRQPDVANDAFQNWLIEVCSGDRFSQDEREQHLINWAQAPSARYCHPREEHLLPLHVCQSMAGQRGKLVFDDYIVGKRSVAFLWN